MDESKATGINVLGPDVNESGLKFSVNQHGDIRFGLGAIKGVGESAVQSILAEREKNGPFKGIFDFVQRVNLSACNRKNIENLALAGSFDSFPEIRREDFFVKTRRMNRLWKYWCATATSIRWIRRRLQLTVRRRTRGGNCHTGDCPGTGLGRSGASEQGKGTGGYLSVGPSSG